MRKKSYVSVIARHGVIGAITPLSFSLEDGQAYRIDKVLALRRVTGTSPGDVKWKYLCLVHNTEIDLYFDVTDQRWFVVATSPHFIR